MSSATIYSQAYPMPAPERRFGYSVAASSVVHGLLIIALASVRPTFTLSPTLLGLPGTLQVQLTEQTVPVIEPPPEPMAPIAVPQFLPMQEPIALEPMVPKAPVLASTASGAPTSQPLVVRQGAADINGSVAVGPLANPELVSAATAARLAQRFPVRAARPPLPRGGLMTAYPLEAARGHINARIAAILTIDAAGKVVPEDTRLSPDDPMFRAAVLAAIAGATFTPAELDGDPMPYWLILDFVFYIDPARNAPTAAGPR